MQGTTDFHDLITHPAAQKTTDVFKDATAFDTTVDVFDGHPTVGQSLIERLLLRSELPSPWLFDRHLDDAPFKSEGQKPEVLQQVTALGQGIGSGIGDALIMDGTGMGGAEKLDREVLIHQHDIFHGVTFFLAAIMAFLLICVFGALNPSFGSIMAKRGGGSWLVSACSCRSVGTSPSPKRSVSCSSERAGASPSLLRVVCKTGNNVWIH
jgi:hypothetical protein